MRTSKFIFTALFFALILTACQKDDMSLNLDDQIEFRNGEETKMVPFKGDFVMPPLGTDFIFCFDPETGVAVPIPEHREVFGNATHLGKIDDTQSLTTAFNCEFSFADGIATTVSEAIIKNKNGDGLRVLGTISFNTAGLVWGDSEVVEGYGKFSNATGWVEANGNLSDGVLYLMVEGMVTQPNH